MLSQWSSPNRHIATWKSSLRTETVPKHCPTYYIHIIYVMEAVIWNPWTLSYGSHLLANLSHEVMKYSYINISSSEFKGILFAYNTNRNEMLAESAPTATLAKNISIGPLTMILHCHLPTSKCSVLPPKLPLFCQLPLWNSKSTPLRTTPPIPPCLLEVLPLHISPPPPAPLPCPHL